ncbi:complement component receptor 1-like protein [Erythrolamprus reginae]|uniref:complement component receptor 1-like protein n=1 Tax=Erythrolamprus reginae TaxID=121349 RepID=UPI00396C9313
MSRSSPVMFGNFFPHLRPRILVLFSLFSGVQGDCGPPPVLKYARTYDPIKSVYKPRESVFYECLPGYRQDMSKPFIAHCSSDKGWNPLEEFCERGCEAPRETRFSVVTDTFLSFYPVGTVVPYVCHRSAYVIPGHPERTASTCFSNYTWSSVPVFCKGQSCGDPGTPDNGDRILMDFLLKAKVNFMCNEGYELIGSPTIQCLSRSFSNNTVVWKPKPPICFRPTCPPPPEIKNGTYTRGKNGTFPLNSNVTYICDLGFSLSGDDLLHCITEDNKTGIWRGSVPECKAQCPTPVLPPHTSLREGILEASYPVGTALRLKCITGYEPISGIMPRITCRDSSTWSNLPTPCQGKRCPVPRFENGRIVDSVDLRLGEEITLGCDYGFRVIGGNTRRCILKDGKVVWDKDVPFCERIPCARPAVIPNGRYDPSPTDSYDAGWAVTYRCDADYTLIGNSTITCVVAKNGVDGEWNWPSPECKIVKCYRPTIPNGKVASVYQHTYTYQNKLPIECNPGYSLVGSSIIECDADSQWKPAGPWCSETPTTSKPTKHPTPAVPSTPPIPPRPGTPKEEITLATVPPITTQTTPKDESATVPPVTTETAPKDDSGSNKAIGIAVGAVISIIVLAALIFAAVKWSHRKGKANTHPGSTDNYHVVAAKDVALQEK